MLILDCIKMNIKCAFYYLLAYCTYISAAIDHSRVAEVDSAVVLPSSDHVSDLESHECRHLAIILIACNIIISADI